MHLYVLVVQLMTFGNKEKEKVKKKNEIFTIIIYKHSPTLGK